MPAKFTRDEIRRQTVERLLSAIIENDSMKLQHKRKYMLDNFKSTSRILYTCKGCGSQDNPCDLFQAAKNKHGCRKCTNAQTNSNKIRSPETFVKELQEKFPDIKILGLTECTKNPKGTARSKILFACPKCGGRVVRAQFAFLREGAMRVCRPCTYSHIHTKGVGTAFKKTKIRERETGKIFMVQGYEKHALRLLKAEGLSMKHLIPSQEVPAIEYTFEGKHRHYFPDLKYKKTIIEVKSDFTAGLKGSQSDTNYRAFRMLKTKAKTCIEQGYKFRLMLFVEVSKGTPKLIEVPEDWFNMKAATLKRRLGLKK